MIPLRRPVRQHILVERVLIKDDYLSPSSLELYDTMHKILSCADAIRRWNPDWTRCPVCQCVVNDDGGFAHEKRLPL